MKINTVDGGQAAILEVQGRGRSKATIEPAVKESQGARAGSSQVEISDRARLMKTAFDSAKGAPDYREAKVNLLKAQVKDGTYRVDADTVAEKLLNDHLETDFGKNNI
ncbi:MAG: flagellar biosynthesis anti-sigma factor FlgM [Deltaproteobacteria bacterium]|nr:flagellar biosynthesis anti-sigma factor FlgM [Deltaproteobacteria bacterium]